MVVLLKRAMESNIRVVNVGRCLKEVLLEAKKENRLSCGFYHTALLLESVPDSVLLCVLSQNHMDKADVHLHSLLIEAFCLENGILLLKIDSEEKLCHLLGDVSYHFISKDFHCIGIQFPKESSTLVDNLLQLYKELHTYPNPIIELPV